MEPRPEHLVKRARERLDAGDAYAAIHLLKELVVSGQAFADAHNLLGLAHAMVGQRTEAMAEFDAALKLNPRYVDAQLNRAVTLSDMGQGDEAAAAFAEAQQLGAVDHTGFAAPAASQLANLHAELGDAYLEAGGRTQAIAQFETAAQLRPEFVDLRYRLARLYLDEGNLEPARDELQSITSRRPGFVDAHVALGMARYLLKDMEGARAAWGEARRLAPSDVRVSAYLSLLQRVGG
ncbi:MAG TPA: tetratricopeptide repeat protein [Gemmatimonadales bacterium]|jgi:tetratricopeptide (TPR) repeat protein